jgi:hypothetical protein
MPTRSDSTVVRLAWMVVMRTRWAMSTRDGETVVPVAVVKMA